MGRTYWFSDAKAVVDDNLVRLRQLMVYGTDFEVDFLRRPDQESGSTFYWTDDIDSIHFAWYRPDSGIFEYIPEGGSTFEPAERRKFERDIEREESYNGSHICDVFRSDSTRIFFNIEMNLYREGVKVFNAELIMRGGSPIFLDQKIYDPGADQSPSETRHFEFAYPSLCPL